MRYDILVNCDEEILSAEVTELLGKGWRLKGNLVASQHEDGHTIYAQVIVKD